MSKTLTNEDYCNAAEELGCTVAMIKAVAETESAGHGFKPDGRIVLRFEGHKFKTFTGGKFDHTHPHLSYPYKLQRGKDHGYTAFNEAFQLDRTSALLATSFGKFQPMGFTHEEAGFDDVHKFVDFLKESEANQLTAFVRLIKHRGLDDEMRRATQKDCETIARIYNGSAYKDNHYDTKIFNAKERYLKEKIDCTKVSAAATPTDTANSPSGQIPTEHAQTSATEPSPITETKTTEVMQTDGVTVAVEQSQTVPKGDTPDVPPTKVSKNGPLANWLFSGGTLTAFGTGIWAWMSTNGTTVGIALLCVTALILALIFRGALTDAIRMTIAGDVDKKNVS